MCSDQLRNKVAFKHCCLLVLAADCVTKAVGPPAFIQRYPTLIDFWTLGWLWIGVCVRALEGITVIDRMNQADSRAYVL